VAEIKAAGGATYTVTVESFTSEDPVIAEEVKEGEGDDSSSSSDGSNDGSSDASSDGSSDDGTSDGSSDDGTGDSTTEDGASNMRSQACFLGLGLLFTQFFA